MNSQQIVHSAAGRRQRRPARHTQHNHSCRPASAGIQNCASIANAGMARMAPLPAPSRQALPAMIATVCFTRPPGANVACRAPFRFFATFAHTTLARHHSMKRDSSRSVLGRLHVASRAFFCGCDCIPSVFRNATAVFADAKAAFHFDSCKSDLLRHHFNCERTRRETSGRSRATECKRRRPAWPPPRFWQLRVSITSPRSRAASWPCRPSPPPARGSVAGKA